MRRCGDGMGRSRLRGSGSGRPLPVRHAGTLADLLEQQAVEFGAGAAAKANIAKLRAGARAVVTGQQVVLFGGPLLTILKAATAVARAKEATAATGVEHVPVFWLATEDHDLAEVDQVSLLTKTSVETLQGRAEGCACCAGGRSGAGAGVGGGAGAGE